MIKTPRLILRPWRDSDLRVFAEQNADPIVMRFLAGVLTPAESDAYVARAMQHLARTGFCKWAVEAPGVAPFIGAVGLSWLTFEAPFAPAVEVAWRLHRHYWGFGYATEAAAASLDDGFNRVGLTDVVALTALANTASIRVMQRLGMTRTIEFDHPKLPQDSPLRRHILYRLPRADHRRPPGRPAVGKTCQHGGHTH
ncbi:GNAT family N-acetyltransferase [Rhodopila sp.]|uniref:GNAT family N-acetyltransferase n=1 Tax=Rhodopila sp. TaxID=2480087 RepID=UPI003D142A95